MKKFILLLIFVFTALFTSCSSDKNYIETVKSITLESGLTIEELAQTYVDTGEFFIANQDKKMKMEDMTFNFEAMMSFWIAGIEMEKMFETFEGGNSANSETYNQIKPYGVKVVRNSPMKWEIEGSTNDSKIIKISSNNVYLKFPTYKDGDYVREYTDEIELYFNNNKKFPLNTLNTSYEVLNFLRKFE